MNRGIKQRLGWVKLFEETGHAGLVCLKCGISRPTLRKWRRYAMGGEKADKHKADGLKPRPSKEIFAEQETLILRLRDERSLGHRRLVVSEWNVIMDCLIR